MYETRDQISKFQFTLLVLAILVFASMTLGDALVWHRGFSELDECSTVRKAWEMFHGGILALSVTTGSLTDVYIGLSQWALGPRLLALHLPTLLLFALENVLLWRMATRHFGKQCAWGAVMFNLLCVFSFARVRSLLSYANLPCELMLVLELAETDNNAARIAAGFLAGIFSLDYEAWVLSGWPVLIIVVLGIIKPTKPGAKAQMIGGFVIGAGLALALSWDNLQSYWTLRTHFTLQAHAAKNEVWGQSLLGLFKGAETLPGFGNARNHPSLAPWAWPILALGIVGAWHRSRAVLAWLAAGLILLIPPSAGFNEFQRSIAAWPAFCLLAGLGYIELQRRGMEKFRFFPFVLLAWLVPGVCWECQAFLQSQAHYSASYYGRSRAELEAAAWLKAQGPVHLLSSLGFERASEFEWMCPEPSPPQGKPVALIFWEALPPLGNQGPLLHRFRDPDGGQEVYLLQLEAPWDQRLLSADSYLSAFWNAQPHYDRLLILKRIAAALHDPNLKHPWIRTELWERRMTEASQMGLVDAAMIQELRAEPLLHAGPLYFPAQYLSRFDLNLAAELHAQALMLDPRLKAYEASQIAAQR